MIQKLYLNRIKILKSSGLMGVKIFFLLVVLMAGCTENEVETTSPGIVENPVDTFSEFIELFPEKAIPFDLKAEKETFDPAQYTLIPEEHVLQFMQFEHWAHYEEAGVVPLYMVGRIAKSDTSTLLIYMSIDSIPDRTSGKGAWEVRNLTMAHVTNEGRMLGHFVMGQMAETAGQQDFSGVSILQGAGMTTPDSGYVHIITEKFDEEVREENYIFSVAPDGTIDSEFVIKTDD